MTTTIYRNDSTGYTVILTDNGRGFAEVADSLNYRFSMVGADYPHAAVLAKSRAHLNGAVEVPAPVTQQMTSPLAADARVRSTRPLVAGVVGEPTLPQARCLQWSAGGTGYLGARPVRRGRASVTGATAPLDVLIAMSRRGWMTLDHPIRPMAGDITDAGRRALATYIAKHGEVL
jgi:hypothetical protein